MPRGNVGDLGLFAKILLRAALRAFVRLWLGRDVSVEEVRAADKELQARARAMDKLFEVRLRGEREPWWLHVEVAAVWESDLPSRMLDYRWLARQVVPGPIGSLLICLKPGARQGEPTNIYREDCGGSELSSRFSLVRAWDWRVGALLERDPGLIPFVPYALDASPARVDEAIRAADAVEPALRAELLAALAVFAQMCSET